MPDPNLLQALLSRTPQAQGPDPNQAPGTGQEGVLDKAMSLIGGATGLPPGPDNQWRRGGALLGAAIPFGVPKVMGELEKFPQVLQDLFKSNPEAFRAYQAAQKVQMAEPGTRTLQDVLAEKAAANAEAYKNAADQHDALLDLAVPAEARPRPFRAPNGFSFPIPQDKSGPPPTVRISRTPAAGLGLNDEPGALNTPAVAKAANVHGRWKFTPAQVRALGLYDEK